VNPIDPDHDDDGLADAFDCMPLDEIAWTRPSVAENLVLAKTLADNLARLPPLDPGSVTLWFDVLMSGQSDDFSGAVRVETDGLDLVATRVPGFGSATDSRA
jgi:hypothetical protein